MSKERCCASCEFWEAPMAERPCRKCGEVGKPLSEWKPLPFDFKITVSTSDGESTVMECNRINNTEDSPFNVLFNGVYPPRNMSREQIGAAICMTLKHYKPEVTRL